MVSTRIRARAAGGDDPPRRLDPVQSRHADVHEDHVGLELARQLARPASPSSASPTTSRSDRVSTISRKPLRTSAWSSAMRTRIGTGSVDRDPGRDEIAAARARAGVDAAAEHGDALAHADRGRCRRSSSPPPVPSSRISSAELVAVADAHGRVLGVRVLERVRQRLLHDPIGGKIDRRRQRPRRALELERDRRDRSRAPARRGCRAARAPAAARTPRRPG